MSFQKTLLACKYHLFGGRNKKANNLSRSARNEEKAKSACGRARFLIYFLHTTTCGPALLTAVRHSHRADLLADAANSKRTVNRPHTTGSLPSLVERLFLFFGFLIYFQKEGESYGQAVPPPLLLKVAKINRELVQDQTAPVRMYGGSKLRILKLLHEEISNAPPGTIKVLDTKVHGDLCIC